MDQFQDDRTVKNNEYKWMPFLRQVLVSSISWLMFFLLGLFIGSTTVVMPQLRLEANLTAAVTANMSIWISSASCYSAIFWVFILPNFVEIIGRKRTVILVSVSIVASFIVFYFSTTPVHLLIAQIMIGQNQASVITVNVIVISEYTSPKYRGLFLTIKSATLFWGIWVSNTIGTFAHWRYIPICGLACSIYLLTVFFWPESPHWLASKKKFYECKQAHRWLKGTGRKQEEELEKLLQSYSNDREKSSNFKFVTKKEFYMPLFISILTVAQYNFSGKFVLTVYALEIMKKIMDNERNAYKCMLILDGITVLSCYIGCLNVKLFKRRIVLLTASIIAIIFLFTMSLYLYLIKLSIVDENLYLSVFFLGGFSISISSGPMIMSTSLYGEIISHKYKNISIILVALSFFIIHGVFLRVSPIIFVSFGTSGAFLVFGILSSICAVLVYFYLPETKDKTLLEIEEYFKDGVRLEERRKLVK